MNMGNLSLIWAMTLFQPEMNPTPSSVPTTNADESLQSVQSAASNSMLQTMILSTIFDAYVGGKLDLST